MKKIILRQQREWARNSGVQFDARGYVTAVKYNLRIPLSPATLNEFAHGGGSELKERTSCPPKMHALHSSAVLAANVFEHWRFTDPAPLLEALGIDSELSSLSFEKGFSTGLHGTPPNVDVALELSSGAVIGIESKFTEWLTPKPGNKLAFKEKYFGGAGQWAAAGLPECQKLAGELKDKKERFRFLDAPQLLKHGLGMAKSCRGQRALLYLFYEASCPVATAHREEITRFTARVGAELHFTAMTYQQLYHHWRARMDVDQEYLQYLGRRYFDAPFSTGSSHFVSVPGSRALGKLM